LDYLFNGVVVGGDVFVMVVVVDVMRLCVDKLWDYLRRRLLGELEFKLSDNRL